MERIEIAQVTSNTLSGYARPAAGGREARPWNAEEVADTIAALRRALPLVYTGQLSDLAGCRIEGALGALNSISGDPASDFARAQIADTTRRLTAIRAKGEMTAATAHRTEGALLALQSIAGDPASLLAELIPHSKLPPAPSNSDDAQPDEIIWTHLGQPPTTLVQLDHQGRA